MHHVLSFAAATDIPVFSAILAPEFSGFVPLKTSGCLSS
jgi:hypothetical protein